MLARRLPLFVRPKTAAAALQQLMTLELDAATPRYRHGTALTDSTTLAGIATFSRSNAATDPGVGGSIADFPINAIRGGEDLINLVRNPAVAGGTGSGDATVGGNNPTNLLAAALINCTVAITGRDMAGAATGGIPWVEYTVTATGAASGRINLDGGGSTLGLALPNNGKATLSAYLQLIGTVPPELSNNQLRCTGADITTMTVTPTGSFTRHSATFTWTSGATTATGATSVTFTTTGACTFVLRIGAPQMEIGPAMTALVLPPLGTISQGYRPTPYQASAAVNQIRNPRFEGAGVGVTPTPGNTPNLSNFSSVGGLTTEILGTGTENGVPYMDVKFTAAATLAAVALTYDSGYIPALAGETWTLSAYARVLSGAIGAASFWLSFQHFTAAFGSIGVANTTIIPTADPLAAQRFAHTGVNPATTGQMLARLRISSTAAFDVTLRLGAAQVEKAAAPTPLMLPPVGAPAAGGSIQAVPPLGWLIEPLKQNVVAASIQACTAPTAPNLGAATTEIARLHPNAVVNKHVRDNALGDNNVGYWTTSVGALTGSAYSIALYVWVPLGAVISGATLSIEGAAPWDPATITAAVDLTRREQWQRVRLDFTTTGAGAGTNPNLVLRVNGDTGAVLYSTLPQLEATPITSPILTTGIPASRSPDVVSISGAAFDAIFGAGAPVGTAIFEFMMDYNSGVVRWIGGLDDNSSTTLIAVRPVTAGNTMIGVGTQAGVGANTGTLSPVTYGIKQRVGLRWGGGTWGIHYAGNNANTAHNGAPLTHLRIGSDRSGGSNLSGRVRLVRGYNYKMDDAAIAAACVVP